MGLVKSHLILQGIKQSLHTINGLLIKKFLAFGPEIVSYRTLNDQIARLFRDFIVDYLKESRTEETPNGDPSIFEEAKTFFNYVKEFHDHQLLNKRLSWLNYNFSNRALGTFFGREMNLLRGYILSRKTDGLGDYTKSMAYNYRAVELSQTRNLGYLPHYLAREQAEEFQKVVTRDLESLPVEEFKYIYQLVRKELRDGGIADGRLKDDKSLNRAIKDSVKFELKNTASIKSTVSEGGKLEDARKFLQLIRENGWRIPIRDLRDFSITDYTPALEKLPEDNDAGFNLSSILFWFSLQNTINFLVVRKLWDRGNFYPLFHGGKIFMEKGILDAKILLINEPGKARKLVKSHPIFNWMLIPGAKISQKILAEHPDHKAGLELGAHDWMHSKRISGESEESSFMYNNITGRSKPTIFAGYTDWTEATDRMAKRRGIAHLRAYFDHISFPEAYGKIIMIMIREPQDVVEVVRRTTMDEFIEDVPMIWKGQIKEGFMMGNQMTKTLLHLCHVSERGFVEEFLARNSIKSIRRIDFNQRKYYRPRSVPFKEEEPIGNYKLFTKT